MRIPIYFALLCALAAAASADILDDFNRPGPEMGANWGIGAGTWYIENDRGRSTGSSVTIDWVGTPNALPYNEVRAGIDAFADADGLNYVALRTGVGTDELFIKIQEQGDFTGFNYVGFYHRTGPGLYSSWPGGAGFVALPTPVTQGRMTTYFLPGDADTIYLDIDTDFNGTPDISLLSHGVLNIAANLGTGVGIGSWGSATTGASMFDNFAITPEPACLGLLLVAGLFIRRR